MPERGGLCVFGIYGIVMGVLRKEITGSGKITDFLIFFPVFLQARRSRMGVVLDILFVGLAVGLVVLGYRQGIVRSFVEFVGGILAFVATIFLAGRFSAFLSVILKESMQDETTKAVVQALSALILFVLLQLLVRMAAKAVDMVFHLPGLHLANQILGAVFGLLKGIVVVLLLCGVLEIAGSSMEVNGELLSEALPSSVVYSNFYAGYVPTLVETLLG